MPHYLKARFSTLMNPFSSEAGTGYHLTNSLMAIGNGGLFGRGLGNGIMKLGYLQKHILTLYLQSFVRNLV